MLRRRQINANPEGRIARFLLGIVDVARWPFERLVWTLERRLLWPLQNRAAGWAPPRRAAGIAVLTAVAGATVLVGVLALTGGETQPERTAAPAPVAITLPDTEPASEGPDEGHVLQGAPPSFGVGEEVGVTDGSSEPTDEANGSLSSDPGGEADSVVPEDESAAVISASGKKPVPAGPAAMKVARRFSEAFVSYEVGERRARAETVFTETATPQLAEALAERPPRQPQGSEVPRARVVNLVPGPRAGRAYTVSVSLLRVGLTTELRLELRRNRAAWLVTDVRG
jgi:hypothetical protein